MSGLLGVVLAGGASRRFGTDKAQAEAFGRPLLDHAIDALAGMADAVVVCGHAYPRAVCLPDRPTAALGPLGGLNAGLHHAAANGFDLVMTIACDTPFVTPSQLAMLRARIAPCVVSEHPVVGIWPAALADDLDRFLAESPDRSIKAWMRVSGAGGITIPGIANINYREDLDRVVSADRT